jgi:hypothetical protein
MVRHMLLGLYGMFAGFAIAMFITFAPVGMYIAVTGVSFADIDGWGGLLFGVGMNLGACVGLFVMDFWAFFYIDRRRFNGGGGPGPRKALRGPNFL